MKLPVQTKRVEHKTYDANAVTEGVNASFWGSLVPILAKAAKGAIGAFS
ncbi:hypothetical protein [uncultured Kordia sp.]|nr:hypothetical protein [uncultured Kordia sp.]